MTTSKNAAPSDKAEADALAADQERSHHRGARVRATITNMQTFAYVSSIAGVPEAVPTVGAGGAAGPTVSFHWFSAVPFDAEIDASQHSEVIPSRWTVTMTFSGDGTANVDIDARNADDLLYRLVGCCTLNGVPHRIEKPQPIPEEG